MRGSRTVLEAWRASRTAGRRARNLRRGTRADASRPAPAALPGFTLPRFTLPVLRAPRPAQWIAIASALAAVVGAVVIASHARQLSVAAGTVGAVDGVCAAAAFQAVLPGAAFTVNATPGITLEQRNGAALLMASNMRGEAPLRIDLCSQMADRATGRLLPLRLGVQFSDVEAWAARNASGASNVTPRNVVLAAPGAPMPRIEITGTAAPIQRRRACATYAGSAPPAPAGSCRPMPAPRRLAATAGWCGMPAARMPRCAWCVVPARAVPPTGNCRCSCCAQARRLRAAPR
jgi:hypothetical protein